MKRVYTIGAAAAKIESLLVLRFQVTAVRPLAGFELPGYCCRLSTPNGADDAVNE